LFFGAATDVGGILTQGSKTRCVHKKGKHELPFFVCSGAGNETRTRDLNLGKVALYQLSYSRLVASLVNKMFCCSAKLAVYTAF
jgi:hypothetical protein